MIDPNITQGLSFNKCVIFDAPNPTEDSRMQPAAEVDFIHSFQPNTDENPDELPQDDDVNLIQNAQEEYESAHDINKLLADFLESIRQFVENKFDSDLVIEDDNSKSHKEINEQIKQVQASENNNNKDNKGVKSEISPELFNEDGTLKNKFDEIETDKKELESKNVTIGKRYNEGYVEVDYTNDGLYDQRAKYDENGNKYEEEIDTNGDGKLDTIVGYDESGKVIWKMADTDFDGSIDLSEAYD